MQPGLADQLGLSRRAVAVARAGIVAWAGIGVTLLAYGAFHVAVRLRPVLLSLGIAAVVVALLEPVVSRLERRGVTRWAGAACAYVAIFVPAGAGVWSLLQAGAAQLRQLMERGPQLVEGLTALAEGAGRWIREVGIPLPTGTRGAWVEQSLDRMFGWAAHLVTVVTGLTGVLLPLLLAPALAFYLLVALPRIRRTALALLPTARGKTLLDGLTVVGGTIGGFLRGQLLVAGLVGLLSTVGLLLLGVPYAVVVGIVAGITNLVPFFGPIAGSLLGVLLGLAEGGPWLGLWVLVLFVVVQQLESLVLSPLLVGRTVRLRPFAVIVAILAGGFAAGILGMILAIPLVASVKALYLRFGPVEAGVAPSS